MLLKQFKTIVFASDPFADEIVKYLHSHTQLAVLITQPDRPFGRGQKLVAHPLKRWAADNDVPVLQPTELKNAKLHERLVQESVDFMVVVAYGPPFIPASMMSIARYGCINVHPSLLPKYKGASPIPAAILAGDLETGVSIIRLAKDIDAGGILGQTKVPIASKDTSESLAGKLSNVAVPLLEQVIWKLGSKQENETKQGPLGKGQMTQKIKKTDAKLDFNQSVIDLERMVRAYYPWPIAWTESAKSSTAGSMRLQIITSECIQSPRQIENEAGLPIITQYGLPAITASDGLLILTKLRVSGKKTMDGFAFIRGYRNAFLGARFG